jgi:hypothetical protein
MPLEEEVQRLGELLDVEDLVPFVATTGLAEISDDAKNAFAAALARHLDPPPSGRLLARLPLIVTDANRDDLVSVMLTNLRSPDPNARRASLGGLNDLGYERVTDLALASLRDDVDAVVAAATQILVGDADDPRVRGMLSDLYAAHRDEPEFHLTRSLLEAHGIGEA